MRLGDRHTLLGGRCRAARGPGLCARPRREPDTPPRSRPPWRDGCSQLTTAGERRGSVSSVLAPCPWRRDVGLERLETRVARETSASFASPLFRSPSPRGPHPEKPCSFPSPHPCERAVPPSRRRVRPSSARPPGVLAEGPRARARVTELLCLSLATLSAAQGPGLRGTDGGSKNPFSPAGAHGARPRRKCARWGSLQARHRQEPQCAGGRGRPHLEPVQATGMNARVSWPLS